MKRILVCSTLLILSMFLNASDILGQWNGMLDVMGIKLRIIIHVSHSDVGYVATLDSPDQNTYGLIADSVSFDESVFEFSLNSIRASYKGTLKDDIIEGVFSQAKMDFPLQLCREAAAAPAYIRPQEPQEPFPYQEEEVIFENKKAGIKLHGTITKPTDKDEYLGVVLVSGSGPQNRDEEIFGHKPFWVLADHLSRNGIVVLRYDDRGTAKSEGDFGTATTYDLLDDALAAVEYLKNQPQISKVGIIGHSEGGIIAPMAATMDQALAFIVILAGTGVRGDELLMRQVQDIMLLNGEVEEELEETMAFNRKIYDLVLAETDETRIHEELDKMIMEAFEKNSSFIQDHTIEQFKEQIQEQIFDPWMQSFIRLNPKDYLKQLKIPVLAVGGSLDMQVSADVNLGAISSALEEAGNKHFKTIEYPGLNHLFQNCKTGNPSEYASIEETFNEAVMKDIVEWIESLR